MRLLKIVTALFCIALELLTLGALVFIAHHFNLNAFITVALGSVLYPAAQRLNAFYQWVCFRAQVRTYWRGRNVYGPISLR